MKSEERAFDDALAAWKRAAVPSSNARLSARVTQAAVGDFRFRKRVKWAARAAGGTVCLFALGFAIWFSSKANKDIAKLNATVINPFQESNKIFESFAKSITTETLETPKIPEIETPAVAIVSSEIPAFPDANRYISISQTARTSIEPVTQPASRAVNRLVKDLGSAFALPKPKM